MAEPWDCDGVEGKPWDWDGDDAELVDCELLEDDCELDWLDELDGEGVLGELLLELLVEDGIGRLAELWLPLDWQAANARLKLPKTTNLMSCIC